MLTSTQNPRIKYVRRLQMDRRFRLREKLFIVEGDRWLAELINFGLRPHLTFVTPGWLNNSANKVQLNLLTVDSQLVDDPVMAHMSDTESPPGILIVLPIPDRPFPTDPTLILILDRLNNPGNLGTILRTAAAASVDGVLLAPGCVDPYNPKVVRGGMGAHLRLPIRLSNWPEIAAFTAGLQIWLASARAQIRYDQVDWRQPSALIIGSEAAGAGEEADRLGAGLTIPMAAATESLNAAVAAGIILFEAARQRALSRA